jgi:hypothetical protein
MHYFHPSLFQTKEYPMANRDDMNRVIRQACRELGGEVLGGNTSKTAGKQVYFRVYVHGKSVDLFADVNGRGTIIWGHAQRTDHLVPEERNIIADVMQRLIHGS